MEHIAAELILDVYRGKGQQIDSLEYVIHEGGGLRIIAIGGSDGALDWMNNFRILPWRDKRLGWCHAGFLKSARPFWEANKEQFSDGTPTLIAGHSKGGAEATLLAAFMAQAGNPCSLVTFGSPRCAFWGLKSVLAPVHSTRYVNKKDPVPRVPPALVGYRHHCDKTKLTGNGHSMSEYRDAILRG